MRPRFFPTPAAFRAWLEEHHETETELVVGFHRKGSGKSSITWPESVDEALCFGWIDGVRRSLNPTAYTIRFTPRRSTSIWSAVNVARVAELKKNGRMRSAGRRASAARTPERTGIYSFERKKLAKLSKEQEKTLRANRKAAAFFDAQPPGYRRLVTHWVTSAKRRGEEGRNARAAGQGEISEAGLTTIRPHRPPSGFVAELFASAARAFAFSLAKGKSSRTSYSQTLVGKMTTSSATSSSRF